MLKPREFSAYQERAKILWAAQPQGVAVTSIDGLIAAIALEHGAALLP